MNFKRQTPQQVIPQVIPKPHPEMVEYTGDPSTRLKESPLAIVGLDLSLTGTGMCRIQRGKVTWAIKGTAAQDKKAKPRIPDHEWDMIRIGKLFTAITEFCEGADLVTIEGLAGITGKGSAENRIGLAYLVRYWLWKRNIPFVLVAPSTLKKFIAGRAAAKGADGKMKGTPKEVIIREVFRIWGHEVDDDNLADAIVLAYVGSTIAGVYDPEAQSYSAAVRGIQIQIARNLAKEYPKATQV